jgi:Amt family ammonium transporter
MSLVAQVGAETAAEAPVFDGLSTMWVLLAAILVFFMQAGFSMVEAGLIRTKNAANVLMKNLIDFSLAALAFYAIGYAIMYGTGNSIVGTTGWFLSGLDPSVDGLPIEAFWLFQAVFAGTTATIVSGAVAERMKFGAYLMYSFMITALVYPVAGHWVWGGGWLSEMGFHDFAGSTVVHAVGGAAALVGAWMVGPRIGRFNKDGSSNVINGHSMPLVAVGTFILWFGWYGFNAGSTLGFGEPDVVARVAMNTTLAPAMGVILALVVSWMKYGKTDLTLALNGALAGLVGITAPCAAVNSGGAIVIGAVSGILVVLGIGWLNKIRVDDPVGAIPVHGLCGIWGTLAVGLFGYEAFGANSDGLLVGGSASALGVQAIGTFSIVAFTIAAMWVVFKIIKSVVGLRVSEECEIKGIDTEEHGLEAYGGFQIFDAE